MLNFGEGWNTLSTTTRIALFGALIGLIGMVLIIIDKV